MKGGISSGVVYPSAVVALSERFHFVNVGGASAGAIAAALTAAAEYARSQGSGAGFERLAALPEWFRKTGSDGRSNLLGLFQPTTESRRLFTILIRALNRDSSLKRGASAVLAALAQYPFLTIAGTLPGLAVLAGGVNLSAQAPAVLAWCVAAIGLLLAAAGGMIGAGFGASRDALKALPVQGFGLCTGTSLPETHPALAEWLANEINIVAGRNVADDPLTLGDLRTKGLQLVVLTTNLTHGRPYTIPFTDQAFAFDPAELERYLPKRIVQWLVEHARTQHEDDLAAALKKRGLFLLPSNDDLPVVFAARLSLSFPVLISAVPLWTFDFTRTMNIKRSGGRPNPTPERCWFSDGGIGSNFPVHFFDGPIPRWPTFALNLRAFHPDHPRDPDDESNNVWRASTNFAGLAEAWNRFTDGESPYTNIAGFFGAIIGTMHNWHDNALLHVPGYRDRIVHVSLADDEGGLNLDMPVDVLHRLELRGAAAGRLLAVAFGAPSTTAGTTPSAWDNHRWVRLRTTMNLLEELHGKLCLAYSYGPPPTYEDLLKTLGMTDPYPWDAGQQAVAQAAVKAFYDLWQPTSSTLFGGHVPRPVPYLTLTPPTALPPREPV
jgi:hypothetical protein